MITSNHGEHGGTQRGRINALTRDIISAAIKVHTVLGPGLLESAYEACLAHELRKRGFHVVQQVVLPVVYDGTEIDAGYRLDLIVNNTVIVELKAVEMISALFQAQLLSYLKLSGKPVGLLINFHEVYLRDGIKRLINGDLDGQRA
jgi:GxxExxY protein